MAQPVPWDPRGVLRAKDVDRTCGVERFLPCAPLADSVEHLWCVSWNLSERQTMTGETLPHPTVHVVIEEGGSGVHGVSTERFSRVLEGRGRAFGVRFFPGCFEPFSQLPVHELTDRVLPLAACLGAESDELEEAILSCETDAEAAAEQAEAYFLARLSQPDPKTQLARDSVRLAKDHPDLRTAGALAEACGLSLRALQRLFHDYVGVSPKWVIQRYRLHEAVHRLERDPKPDLALLAQELGYTDQAHFTRDFKAVVGLAPGTYLKDRTDPGLS